MTPKPPCQGCDVRRSGAGEFASAGQARSQVHYQYRYFYPQTEPELSEGV